MQLFRRDNPGYYQFQRLVGRALLGWGGANAVLGLAAQASPNRVIKQVGMQSLGWGGINAIIALFGLRDAQRKQAQAVDAVAQARRFRLIVAVNALLDIGYMLGGLAVLRGANSRPERVGMGSGIMLQGAFLFLFDIALALLAGRWVTKQR